MEAMEEELKRLMLGLGANLKASPSPTLKNKSSRFVILKRSKAANLLLLSHLPGKRRRTEDFGL